MDQIWQIIMLLILLEFVNHKNNRPAKDAAIFS